MLDTLYWDVLSDLQADDVGLWEVRWRANTIFANASSAHRNEIVEDVVLRLLRGSARLINGPAGQELGAEQTQAAIAGRQWLDDPPAARLWLTLTAAGVEEYRRMPPAVAAVLSEIDR